MSLPLHLWEIKESIRKIAVDLGLDFFKTIFEVVDYKRMNEIAAFGGYPTRYPHWRFGMEYEQLSKSYAYGLSKIYEMVINNNPCYAYLLEGNNLVDQKTVIAHVYGHCDFFKNNYYFSKTNRKMMDEMANHATRIRRYIDRFGIEKVESFIDVCLSIDNLIDYYSPFIVRKPKDDAQDDDEPLVVPRLRSKDYMEDFINPPEYLEEQRKKMEQEREKQRRFPEIAERDVMYFLLQNSPLESWEADVLSIIREEAYYFAPQGQTKIMNEGWACVAPDTLVFTDHGLIPMEALVERGAGTVFDGERQQQVYDRNILPDHDTVTIHTRRGLRLCGSNNHRVLLEDRVTWRRLDELRPGDTIAVSGGGDLWASSEVPLDWAQPLSQELPQTNSGRSSSTQSSALAWDLDREDVAALSIERLEPVQVPTTLCRDLSTFLGDLVGLGSISPARGQVAMTTTREAQALRFLHLGQSLFDDATALMHRDQDTLRWHVRFHGDVVSDFLTEGVGLATRPATSEQPIPAAILRSPRHVVAAFLRALFDSHGQVLSDAVVLDLDNEALARQVQLLLLNFGVLHHRQPHQGRWRILLTADALPAFAADIGFGLEDQQDALDALINTLPSDLPQQPWTDSVVSTERGRGDVYDISVTDTHRYVAAGLINHNSYWHSKILTEHALDGSEIIDYAEAYAGVMATSPGQFNPYKIGIELFRNIEERWNRGQFGKEWEECDNMAERENWNRQVGLGRDKIFQVRSIYNDVTFIDEFLTEDFCREQKIFTFGYNKKSRNWEIESREFKEIKQKLLFQLTNFGQPMIYVKDGNFANRAELLLHHKFEGVELKLDYARDVLQNISSIWRRPVNLETIVDGKGRLYTFDGSDHSDRPIDYEPL